MEIRENAKNVMKLVKSVLEKVQMNTITAKHVKKAMENIEEYSQREDLGDNNFESFIYKQGLRIIFMLYKKMNGEKRRGHYLTVIGYGHKLIKRGGIH